MSSALRMLGLCFTYIFYGPVAYDKDSIWYSFKHFFQITTMLSLGQQNVQYKPVLRVGSVQRHQLIDMVATYDFFT